MSASNTKKSSPFLTAVQLASILIPIFATFFVMEWLSGVDIIADFVREVPGAAYAVLIFVTSLVPLFWALELVLVALWLLLVQRTKARGLLFFAGCFVATSVLLLLTAGLTVLLATVISSLFGASTSPLIGFGAMIVSLFVMVAVSFKVLAPVARRRMPARHTPKKR